MKYCTRIVALAVFMLCINGHAQRQTQVAPVYVGGCNWLANQLKWKDGQHIATIDVQLILQHLQLPPNWSMSPQSAIDAILNLNPTSLVNLVFHCDAKQKTVPLRLVSFYFSYQQGNDVFNLPEIHISINPPPSSPAIVPATTAPGQPH